MVDAAVVGLGFVAIVVMGASVLGTVDRRERYWFVLGVAMVLVGLTFLPGELGGYLALLGFAVVVGSTVPMLRE